MQKENIKLTGKEYVDSSTADYSPSPEIDSIYSIDIDILDGLDLEYDEPDESVDNGLQSYDLSQEKPEDDKVLYVQFKPKEELSEAA